MLVETHEENGKLVVAVARDRLDASVAADFENELLLQIENGHNVLVVDLEQVEFIDSSGLGAIVSGLKKVGTGNLSICGVQEDVMGVFKLTRLDRVFSIYANAEEATLH